MSTLFRVAFHPEPELEKFDTSLRYTDILFGFVIRELFLRLQNWTQLDRVVHFHLLVGTTLVLGSWIGYRRSLYRSSYQIKFFNLPFFRFIADQIMLVLYFRIAVLTDVAGKQVPPPDELSNITMKLVMYVFLLYAVWDLFGIWIAKANIIGPDGNKRPRYPSVSNSTQSQGGEKRQRANWRGLLITSGTAILLFVVWLLSDCFSANARFLAIIGLVLLYRWLKEVRTSWELLPRA